MCLALKSHIICEQINFFNFFKSLSIFLISTPNEHLYLISQKETLPLHRHPPPPLNSILAIEQAEISFIVKHLKF